MHLQARWRWPLQVAWLQASGCAHCGCARLPSPLAPKHLLPLLLQVAKLQASIQELQDAHQREEEACAEAQQVAEEALQLKRDLEARHVPSAQSRLPSAGGGLRRCCGCCSGGVCRAGERVSHQAEHLAGWPDCM